MLDHRERWRTAVHEAGHVIAAALGNVPIRCVTIVPDDETLGRVRYDGPGRKSDCLAGAAAELALLGDVSASGLNSDRAQADLGPFTHTVWRAVCRQMRLHRQKVVTVALTLLERPTLEMLDLYERVLPPLVPTATHPDLYRYEESSAQWAARVGADQWEPDEDRWEDAEDPLRTPQSAEQGETTCYPY